MDPQTFGLSLCAVLLLATSSVSGLLLLERRNYLLAALWLLLSASGLSFLFFGLYGVPAAYDISRFCDAITTGLGMPTLATAGLMAATHQYRPSKMLSAMLVLAVLAVAMLLGLAGAPPAVQIALCAATWTLFSLYLAYFAWRLARIGAFLHAAGVLLVLVCVQTAVLGGHWRQWAGGGEALRDEQFLLLAGAFLCLELFLAYSALERSVQGAGINRPGRNSVRRSSLRTARRRPC